MRVSPLVFQILAVTISVSFAFPVEPNTDGTDFPILKPADDNNADGGVENAPAAPIPTEDDQTEFPILKPNPDEFEIARPEPIDENDENPTYEQGEDQPVPRPRPEEDGRNLPSLAEFNHRGALETSFLDLEDLGDSGRRNRVNSRSEDSDDLDDTVVVDAASCEDLKKDCDEKQDLLSCEAYKENCSNEGGESEDKEAAEMVNCIDGIAGKGGNKGDCPSLVANP